MAKEKAAWTVMIYLAGDNNLTTECMFALTEMKRATRSEELNIIAQFDPSDPYLPSHRYEINKDDKTGSICPDIIDCARYYKNKREVNFRKESRNAIALAAAREAAREEVRKNGGKKLDRASLTDAKLGKVFTDDTDTGSPVTLYNFISFCLQEYPADRYMVVLSGHAGGTERDYMLKDESSARSLTHNELKQVFRRIKRDRHGKLIDIIGMDNCLMSMAEICYELRDVAEIVVGCESFSPISGWPYRQILERLATDFVDPKLPPEQSVTTEAAKAIVDEYVNFYATYWMAGLSVTQSALNVKKVQALREHIDRLAEAMEKELIAEAKKKMLAPAKRLLENALLLAHWEAQSYNGEQFVDLYDFCDCLEKREPPAAIAQRCNELKQFIKTQFVLKSCYCGATYQYSYGVSIYFPWSEIAPSYWNLDFVQPNESGWGSFLKTYTQLTRRLPRNGMVAPGMMFSRTDQDYTASDLIMERMTFDRMTFDRMTFDRMTFDRMGSAANRIHSMRNPPAVFDPAECVRDRQNVVKSQKIFRLR